LSTSFKNQQPEEYSNHLSNVQKVSILKYHNSDNFILHQTSDDVRVNI